MFDFLALITNKHYWKFHSILIKFILLLYGIKVGKKFYCEGVPLLKIRGKGRNIIIGNNVSFLGDVDLRNRENGKIFLDDNVSIDGNVRLVSANDAVLKIGKGSSIGGFTIFNCGVDVTLGEYCLVSGHCYFQSSEHGTVKDTLIAKQNHTYGKIILGNDTWIASNVTIAKNVELGNGCIVGAKSLLRNVSFEDNSIVVGVPAKRIKYRK